MPKGPAWPGLRIALGLALIAGVVALGALMLAAFGPRGDSAVIDGGLTLASATATVAFLWHQRRAVNRTPWRILAVAAGSTTIGNVTNFYRHTVQGRLASDVGFNEVFFLVGYGTFLLAFYLFFPRSANRRDAARRVVDALVLTIVLTAILWIAFLRDLTLGAGSDVGEAVVIGFYPGLDLAIAAVLLSLATELTGPARRRILLMALGMALFMLGDLGLAIANATGGPLVDFVSLGWIAGYFAFALAGLARSIEREDTWRQTVSTPLATALVYGPIGVLLPLAVFDYAAQGTMDPVLFGFGVAMVAGLSCRQVLLTWDLGSAVRQLRSSEGRLSGILDLQEALVLRVSPDGRITYMNGAYERAFGLHLGDTFWSKIHPEDRAEMETAMGRLQHPPHSATLEQRVETRDGWRRVYWQGSVVKDASGSIVEFQAVGFDVTQRALAQQKLLQREALLLETQTVGRIGSWEIDLVKGTYSCSPENSRLFAIEHKPMHDPAEAMRNLHPDDVTAVQQAIDATLRDGSHEILQRIVLPDGKLRYLRSRGELRRDPQGDPARIVGMSVDVTEQHEADEALRTSEERMRSLLDNLEEVYVSTDLEAGTSTSSAAIEKVFGQPRAVYAADPMAWSKQLHPEDAPRVMANYAQLMAGVTTVDETRIVRPDGQVRWIRASMRPVKDGTGKVVRLDGVLRDITAERESRQHEAEVKRLQEVTAFKTQFLNNAAHELATPLTPIKLQMASLKRSIFGELTPKQADAVGLLDRNLERLSLLVGDLLDAARLQGGRLKIMAKPVSVGRLAADVVQSFAEKAKLEGIALASQGLGHEAIVQGDDARLNQVLFNLVHNALKFTPRGGRIEVALATDGNDVVLSVSDTGIGLTQEQIGRLFEPFVQVHDTVMRKVGGTGLGLYISKGIVEQHGGRMTCNSKGPGQGATFEVRLPLSTLPSAVGSASPQAN